MTLLHARRVATPDGARPALRACAAALLLSAWAGSAAAQTIVGRVIDAASGAGVPEARVGVVAGNRRHESVANADGRYSIALPGAGSYRVQASRTGYQAARTRRVAVGAGETVQLDVRLQPAAVRLRAVTATARRRRLPVRGKFVQTGGGDSAAVRPVTAAAQPRSILAQGTFVAPSACYQLAGVADRTGQVVTLNVAARPNGQTCSAGAAAFDYKVSVRGLPPGSYTFRIAHTFRDAVWRPVMALDTTITVP